MGSKRNQNTASDTMPEPPESGWAWVVVCGAFVIQFMVVGFLASMSVYVFLWINYFEGSAAQTSLIVSLCSFLMGVFSPVAGASCKRFGPRLTAMAGGTLTCAGVIISSQATGIVFLIFSLGVLTAFGMSMATNASYTILGMYFKKRLAIAMGLATAGVSVGQLVLPPFFQYLIDHYGWKGSLMITSALTFHVAVAGALMRPPRIAKPKKPSRKSTGRTAEDEAKAEENGNNIESTGVGSLRALSLLNPSIFDAEDQVGSPNGMALGEGSIFQEEPDVAMTTDIEEDEDRIQYVDDDSWSLSSTPGGDMSALSHSVWVPIAVTALQSMPGKRRQRSFLPGRKPRSASMLSQTLQKQPSELLRLFRNPSFVIMLAVSIAHGFGWASTTYHLVSRAESVGVEPDKAALLLTAMGTGSLVGRLSIGWLADKKWIDPKIYYTCTFAFCALAAFVTPPITVYYALIALALVQGLAFGAATVILFITPGRIVKPVLATTSLSYCLLAWGAGEISGGALAGWFYDALESYDYSFYTAGSVMTAGSGFMLVIFFLQRAKQRCHGHPAKTSEGRHEHVEPGSNPFDPEFAGSKFDDLGRVNPLFFMRERVESERNKGEVETVGGAVSVDELNERETDFKGWSWNNAPQGEEIVVDVIERRELDTERHCGFEESSDIDDQMNDYNTAEAHANCTTPTQINTRAEVHAEGTHNFDISNNSTDADPDSMVVESYDNKILIYDGSKRDSDGDIGFGNPCYNVKSCSSIQDSGNQDSPYNAQEEVGRERSLSNGLETPHNESECSNYENDCGIENPIYFAESNLSDSFPYDSECVSEKCQTCARELGISNCVETIPKVLLTNDSLEPERNREKDDEKERENYSTVSKEGEGNYSGISNPCYVADTLANKCHRESSENVTCGC